MNSRLFLYMAIVSIWLCGRIAMFSVWHIQFCNSVSALLHFLGLLIIFVVLRNRMYCRIVIELTYCSIGLTKG